MLEDGLDQAAGLRKFRLTGVARGHRPLLPVLGAADYPAALAALVTGLADQAVPVHWVVECPAVQGALRGTAAGAALGLARAQQAPPKSPYVTLRVVSDERVLQTPQCALAGGLVLASAADEALAMAYARVKALLGWGAIPELWLVAVPAPGLAAPRAVAGFERLAQTLARFLDLQLEWAGTAPTALTADYRRLAHRLSGWARQQSGEELCRVH